jgi:hypothetical protein
MTIALDQNWRGRGREPMNVERREHRRHDLEPQQITVKRWDGKKKEEMGNVVDLSSGGVRIRANECGIRPDQQIRLRLELPNYAGISPFVDTTGRSARPRNEWEGWMVVTRVQRRLDGTWDIGGRLMDMEELDRGMLGLYLSTQPLAA